MVENDDDDDLGGLGRLLLTKQRPNVDEDRLDREDSSVKTTWTTTTPDRDIMVVSDVPLAAKASQPHADEPIHSTQS
jgi:hypothetical protein